MAVRRFHSARIIGNIVLLDFDADQRFPLSVTIPLENANQLVAGLLKALRTAPPTPLETGEPVTIPTNDLPIDRWTVTDSVDAPGVTFLRLGSGGLSLVYSLPTTMTQSLGDAVAAMAHSEASSHQT